MTGSTQNNLTTALVAAALVLTGCSWRPSTPAEPDGADEEASTTSPPPVAAGAYGRRGAFAVGNTVHIGARTVSVRVPGEVDSLVYTSAGVVVSVLEPGQDPNLGRSRHTYHLVRPNGTVLDLGLVLDGIDTTTDSDAPFLAWVSEGPSEWRIHVLDVVTGEKTMLPVNKAASSNAGNPSVLLDGDTVYLLVDEPIAVDWRTGQTMRAQGVTPFSRLVAGGRVAYPAGFGPGDTERARVLDAVSGETVAALEEQTDGSADLSPSGRLVRTSEVVPSNGPRNRASFLVHDLDSQQVATVEEQDYRWFWTPNENLFRVQAGDVELCSAGTADCRRTPVNLEQGPWTMPEDSPGT